MFLFVWMSLCLTTSMTIYAAVPWWMPVPLEESETQSFSEYSAKWDHWQNKTAESKQNRTKKNIWRVAGYLLKSHQEPLTLKGIKICQIIAVSHSESTKEVGLETTVFSILPLLTLPSYFLRGRCLEFKVNDMNNKVTFPQRFTL